jgi:hypothetical protein
MTVDEEISQLEDALRRLKIEYDVFFGGGSKKPPTDLEWRVQSLIKKYSDNGSKMTYPQRFRYNAIAQRHALFSDLWRQKLKIKEEGYRRPSDAALGIAGLRSDRGSASKPEVAHFLVDSKSNDAQVEAIFEKMMQERERAGLPKSGSLASFKKFVHDKSDQIRKQSGCDAVEYTVDVQEGQVRLTAKAKR